MEFVPKSGYAALSRVGNSRYEEKKSVFLGQAVAVSAESEVMALVKKAREENPRARHVVYAYLLSSGQKGYSEDGEPQGTAGIPILDLIEKSGIRNVCLIIVRYFGGTLLGAGPLMRAYCKAAKDALENGEPKVFSVYSVCRVRVSYAGYQRLLPLLEEFGVIMDGTSFSDDVMVDFALPEELTTHAEKRIEEATAARASFEVLGTRLDCER